MVAKSWPEDGISQHLPFSESYILFVPYPTMLPRPLWMRGRDNKISLSFNIEYSYSRS